MMSDTWSGKRGSWIGLLKMDYIKSTPPKCWRYAGAMSKIYSMRKM